MKKMDNLEKLISAGKIVFGDNWQSPMSRLMNIDDRSIRRYVSGVSRPPYTSRLIEALEMKMDEIKKALELVKSDEVHGEDITFEVIMEIVNQYDYSDIQYKKAAIGDVNNHIYAKTYLSDLHQIAKRWSEL